MAPARREQSYIIGIDLGGTNIKGALVDLEGNILYKQQISTRAEEGPEAVISRMAELAQTITEEKGISKKDIIGVGAGIPGTHDFKTGTVVFSPNLKWRNIPIKKALEDSLGLPVYIDNDANAAALGEKWAGAGRGSENMVMLTIGTGIGGGLILKGELYRGSAGSAGEIGHTIIKEDGPQCTCGNRGCLEALTAAPAIVRRAKRAIEESGETGLKMIKNLEAKDVFDLAIGGDRVAVEVVRETAYYLAIGVANLLNIFNPEVVVIGGGVSKCGEVLLIPLRKFVKAFALEVPAKTAKIVPAQLGNDAGSIGAAAVVLGEIRGF